MKILTLLYIVFFINIVGYSQVNKELPFIEYLIAKEEYNAAIKLLSSYPKNIETQSQDLIDSINYLNGWSLYSSKQLNESVKYFKQVSFNSCFYSKSQIFASYNNTHLKNYSEAIDLLNKFSPKNKQDSIIKNYLKSGVYLLNRDFTNYSLYQDELDKEFYGIKKENIIINSIADELYTHKRKSTTIAAILSSIVPGSGKIYLGKTGQGISSLLIVTGLGLVTAENFNKRGPEKFSSILFASAFTSFYLGNIYGTIKLSKISNEEYNSYEDAKILFNIHIPLRNLYN